MKKKEKSTKINQKPSLCRIALLVADTSKADPDSIFSLYFEPGDRAVLHRNFMEMLKSAMAENGQFSLKMPENWLYFAEKLELMAEIGCLWINQRKRKLPKKPIIQVKEQAFQFMNQYPVSLNWSEIMDPASAIRFYFDKYSLIEVKKWLEDILHSALSNHGLAETADPAGIIDFVMGTKKLIDAAFLFGRI